MIGNIFCKRHINQIIDRKCKNTQEVNEETFKSMLYIGSSNEVV